MAVEIIVIPAAVVVITADVEVKGIKIEVETLIIRAGRFSRFGPGSSGEGTGYGALNAGNDSGFADGFLGGNTDHPGALGDAARGRANAQAQADAQYGRKWGRAPTKKTFKCSR